MKYSLRLISLIATVLLLLGLMAPTASAGKPAPRPKPSGAADISVTVTDSPDPALLVDEITYVITVSNAGPTEVLVWLDAWLENGEFGSVSPTTCTSNYDSTNVRTRISCNLGTLASGGTTSVTVTARPAWLYDVTLRAQAGSNKSDPNLSNNSDTEFTSVIPTMPALPDPDVDCCWGE